jgi:hypothetical protein
MYTVNYIDKIVECGRSRTSDRTFNYLVGAR